MRKRHCQVLLWVEMSPVGFWHRNNFFWSAVKCPFSIIEEKKKVSSLWGILPPKDLLGLCHELKTVRCSTGWGWGQL